MDLSESLVFEVVGSEEEFPISFDDAWKWLDFSRKDNAKRAFENAGFLDGIDFQVFLNIEENPKGGRPSEAISLTVDCFKSFAMMAGTEKGKEVRKYFLECERRLKLLLNESTSQRVKQKLLDSIVVKHVVSSAPKFQEWFYDMLYRKRGGEWLKRSRKDRPGCVGTWTNNVVYNQMLGGDSDESVKARLIEVEPKINGVRKNPLHSHLSGFGMNYLQDHFKSLQLIDRVTPDGDWDRFIYTVEKAFPKEGKELQLNLLYELERFNSLPA